MGKIIIHGKIVEVGGPSPMVKIEHPVGAPITLSTSYEIAKLLGKHLYEDVVMFGSRHPQGPMSASIQVDIYNIQILDKEDGKDWIKVSVDFVGHEGTVYVRNVNPDMIPTMLHEEKPLFKENECDFGTLSREIIDFTRLTQGTWKCNKGKDGN